MSGPGPTWDYRISARIIRGILWLRGRKVEGMGDLPASGALIVAANHVSLLDPPFVAAMVSRVRFPRFLGKEELFRVPPMGAWLRRWGVIPLDRTRGDVRALRRAAAVLREEGCMVVFPEGTRSRTGRPGRPKAGVGLLARESGAPVVPVRVRDTVRWLGLKPLRMRFGKAMRYEEDGSRAGDRRFAEKVMEEIFKL